MVVLYLVVFSTVAKKDRLKKKRSFCNSAPKVKWRKYNTLIYSPANKGVWGGGIYELLKNMTKFSQ
jgi:hypothetical protein